MSETSINVPTNRRVDLEQDQLSITTTDADLGPVYASLTAHLGLIGDNTNSITSLRDDLTSNVASITANQGDITSLRTDLTSNVLSITSLRDDLTSNVSKITAIQGAITSIRDKSNVQAGQITTLSNTSNALGSSLVTLNDAVVLNALNIGNLSQTVSLNTGSITALTGTVSSHSSILTSVTTKLDTISYDDLNGQLPNDDVAIKELSADKMYYVTGLLPIIGGSSYPEDTIGYQVDYIQNNVISALTQFYSLASMIGAIVTLIGNPGDITSLAVIQAEQIVQNARLFELDSPISGRVTINEDNISTLSSSVGTINSSLTALDGSVTNLNNSVANLNQKTTNQSFADGVTSFTGGVIVEALSFGTTDPLDLTSLASLRDKVGGIVREDNVTLIEGVNLNQKTTDLSYATLTSTFANNVHVGGTLSTGNLTFGTLTATDGDFTGNLNATGNTTLGSLTAGNTTLSGTLNVTGATTLGSLTAGNTTVSGTLTTSLIRGANANVAVSPFLAGASPEASFNGFIYTRALVNESQLGGGPSAIVFGDSNVYGSNQISLVTAGNTRVLIQNASTDIPGLLTCGTVSATTYQNIQPSYIPDLDASKITTGVFVTDRIPDLDASKISSGVFVTGRIPNLDASKITSGEFDTALIPNLDASKITSGVFNPARIPEPDFLKLPNRETGDLPATNIDYVNLGWDRNIGNRPSFFYKDPDDGTVIYLLDSENMADISASALSVAPNTDVLVPIGRVKIGQTSTADIAGFAHYDHATGNSSALKQYATGETRVNAPTGQSVTMAINNSVKATIDASGLSVLGNTDATTILGRCRIHSADSDHAIISHYDYSGTSNYGFKQQANGNTYLNAPGGQFVHVLEGNNDGFRFNPSAGKLETFGLGWPSFNFNLPAGISGAGSGAYLCYSSSSQDTKKDIEDLEIDRTINIVENCRPRWFRYNNIDVEDPRHLWGDYGLIAEELETIDRRLVAYGDQEGTVPASVYYDKLGLHAVHYIQKVLNPKIADLEAKIEGILSRL